MIRARVAAIAGGALVGVAACGGGGGVDAPPWSEASLALTWTIDGDVAALGCPAGVTIGVVNLTLPARAPDAADESFVLCREGAGTFEVLALPGANRLFVDAKGDVGENRLLSGEHPVTFDETGHGTLEVDLRHTPTVDAPPATPDAGPAGPPDGAATSPDAAP